MKKNSQRNPLRQSDDEKQPLLSHFQELRRALITSIASIATAFIIIFSFFSELLMEWITAPLSERGIDVIYTSVSEAMLIQVKVSLAAAFIVASPMILFQAWAFVRPALYQHEIRKIVPLFVASLILFFCGIVFCYACVYGLALDFFLVSGKNIATPLISLDRYLSYLLSFVLPFGLAFDLPVVILITTKIGLTTPAMLLQNFKYVVLLISVVAAVLTPPDVISQMMLALPLLFLYAISILVARAVCA